MANKDIKVDLEDIYRRQQIKLHAKKPTLIMLSHFSPRRVNRDEQETLKLKILLSFLKLRQTITEQLEKVGIERTKNGTLTYLDISKL